MYAVIKTGGKQHRVTEGETLAVEKIPGEKGDEVVFQDVLMVAQDGNVQVGTPLLTGVRVIGEITAQTKAKKIDVFKMKRRKGYHKQMGHRQQLTNLRIKEISL